MEWPIELLTLAQQAYASDSPAHWHKWNDLISSKRTSLYQEHGNNILPEGHADGIPDEDRSMGALPKHLADTSNVGIPPSDAPAGSQSKTPYVSQFTRKGSGYVDSSFFANNPPPPPYPTGDIRVGLGMLMEGY
jgi:hypothetical protein